jgi:ketosteroid isomerase-like protein
MMHAKAGTASLVRLLGLANIALVAASALAAAGVATAVGEAALDQMVEAERAFARTAEERGVRDAFLAFLAPNSISVQPYGNARAQWEARPAPPPGAKLARLEWAPRTGDIAASGELGWLTGDFRVVPPTGEPRHGCYFSVWEKQPNGDWRVRIDVGVDTPGPPQFDAPGFTRIATGTRAARGASSRPATPPTDELREADRALAADAASRTTAAALLARLDDHARLHRPASQPLAGRRAIDAAFAAAPPPDVRYEPGADAAAAASGDLGWTIGRYAPKSGAGESGAYVRVWTRDAAGRWSIVADITQPAR